MAQSPAHRFGQIIGDVLEMAIQPLLSRFAQTHGLYLDTKGVRPARRGVKLTWKDSLGNSHDLDFVLERDGTDYEIGTPAAFIETAWRRYTKHSKNKAQEIQGAVLPLLETYQSSAPFIGAILAGVFTSGAITQLKSNGFALVYFSYDSVCQAFGKVGIDAHFSEDTPDDEIATKVAAWDALTSAQKQQVATALRTDNPNDVTHFMAALERAINRQIESIRILALHGTIAEWVSIEDAIAFVLGYNELDEARPIARYEVEISYSNGETIRGQFKDKETTIQFLRRYQPALPSSNQSP
jgi:hypothetical protein